MHAFLIPVTIVTEALNKNLCALVLNMHHDFPYTIQEIPKTEDVEHVFLQSCR